MQSAADEQAIKKLASNLKVFMRGRNLFNAKERVGPLFYDARNLLLSAKVSSFSNHVYDTFVKLRRNGAPEAASCSCSSFGKYRGCCKHVVALLLTAEGQELPDDGLRPPELPPGHLLRGVPLLKRELISFEELLQIVGPDEKKKKRRRGRPPKKKKEEKKTTAKGSAGEGLLIDRTVVKAPKDKGSPDYVKIKPQLSGISEREEQTKYQPIGNDLPDLPSGRIFLDRLFSWEVREQNLLRTKDMHERSPEATRIELYLELTSGLANAAQLFIRVGNRDHIYIVNQLGSFIKAYRDSSSLNLGSYYDWSPPFKLSRPQQLFIDWLVQVRREEARLYHQRVREPFPDAKQMPLNGEHLAELLELCLYCEGELPLYLNFEGRECPLTLRRRLPADLQIKLSKAPAPEAAPAKEGQKKDAKEEKALSLSFVLGGKDIRIKQLRDPLLRREKGKTFCLLHPSGIALYEDVVYFAQNKRDRLIWRFLELLSELPEPSLALNAAEASFFLSAAHDLLCPDKRILWTDGLQDKVVEFPLEIRNYLDISEDTLWLSPFFFYGDYHFRPAVTEALPRAEKGADPSALVVRDRKAELEFERFLEEQGFSEVKLHKHQLGLVTQEARGTYMANQFYLRGEEGIFLFLRDVFPKLRKMGKVLVSPAFRKLKVTEPGRPSVYLDYDDDEASIAVRIMMEGFDEKEAARILRAYQQGANFARLEDGRFVDLGAEDRRRTRYGDDLREIVGTLSDWGAEWRDSRFVIPKYRGLALHGLLEERQLEPENADDPGLEAWDNLIADLKDPAKAAPDLPPGVNAKLRPYQLLGYQWLCFLHRYNMGGILADEMGLGKTLQMLVFLWKLYLEEGGPSLVIAPTSLLYNWKQETERFVPGLPCTVIEGTKAARIDQYKAFSGQGLLIVSYGLARQDRKELRHFDFACIVLDEAQNIKNPLTKTARAVKSLRGKRRFALTGTPLENHIGELWSIFDFLMPGYLFSYGVFQDRFGEAMSVKRPERSADPEEREELRAVQESLHQLVSPFILRRLKQDVLKDLPDKIITDIPCAMTPEQQALYRRHLGYARRQISAFDAAEGRERGRKRMDILGELTRLRQICCDPALFVPGYDGGSGKLDALEDLVNNLTESGHRILLFSQFTSMLKIIKERQEKQGRQVLYIDGQVPSKERLKLVSHFNAGEGEVFLISLKAGGTGLNLTGADVVIHYDPWWNPAVENQATDRAHRLGQRKVVQVFRMVTKGSIEEKIQEMQQRKQALLDDIVAPGATFINRMDLDDIRELFAE